MERQEYYKFLDRYSKQILGHINNKVNKNYKNYDNDIFKEKIRDYIEDKLLAERFYIKINDKLEDKQILKYLYQAVHYQMLNAIKIKHIKAELKIKKLQDWVLDKKEAKTYLL